MLDYIKNVRPSNERTAGEIGSAAFDIDASVINSAPILLIPAALSTRRPYFK